MRIFLVGFSCFPRGNLQFSGCADLTNRKKGLRIAVISKPMIGNSTRCKTAKRAPFGETGCGLRGEWLHEGGRDVREDGDAGGDKEVDGGAADHAADKDDVGALGGDARDKEAQELALLAQQVVKLDEARAAVKLNREAQQQDPRLPELDPHVLVDRVVVRKTQCIKVFCIFILSLLFVRRFFFFFSFLMSFFLLLLLSLLLLFLMILLLMMIFI